MELTINFIVVWTMKSIKFNLKSESHALNHWTIHANSWDSSIQIFSFDPFDYLIKTYGVMLKRKRWENFTLSTSLLSLFLFNILSLIFFLSLTFFKHKLKRDFIENDYIYIYPSLFFPKCLFWGIYNYVQ